MIFEFTCNINPPTKNIQRYLGSGKRRFKNKSYFQPWDLIESLMYQKRFDVNKATFDYLQPLKRAELQKTVTKENVILSLWNGFHRQDASNILTEMQDRLQGIAYMNDRQVKECHIYKDDDCKVEYFKVIVELQ